MTMTFKMTIIMTLTMTVPCTYPVTCDPILLLSIDEVFIDAMSTMTMTMNYEYDDDKYRYDRPRMQWILRCRILL